MYLPTATHQSYHKLVGNTTECTSDDMQQLGTKIGMLT